MADSLPVLEREREEIQRQISGLGDMQAGKYVLHISYNGAIWCDDVEVASLRGQQTNPHLVQFST